MEILAQFSGTPHHVQATICAAQHHFVAMHHEAMPPEPLAMNM
jgi:hypothetical protein